MSDPVVLSSPSAAGDPWQTAAAQLTVALVLDSLDAVGLRYQAVAGGIIPRTTASLVVGRAKTLLWMDFAHDDPATYDRELAAVDALRPGEIVVCASGGSARSGIWGELLATAATARGATGLVTDGAVRDVARMEAMGFPVFSRHLSPLDSYNRQKVAAVDVRIELGGVPVVPGDIVVADRDGVAIVPARLEADILAAALDKAGRESGFRRAVRAGMSLADAYKRFGVL